MLELMNIYKAELKKLIALYERAGEVMFGTSMWKGWLDRGEAGREGAREGERKTVATDDLSLTHLMMFTDWKCAWF